MARTRVVTVAGGIGFFIDRQYESPDGARTRADR